LVLLFLPIRAAAGAPTWGNPTTITGFFDYVTGAAYHHNLGAGAGSFGDQLMDVARYLPLAQMAASLWLLSPLLLSTTLYVVQRMTLQSATFSLVALLLYCRGRRLQALGRSAGVWIGLSLVAMALAFFSKENGLLVLPMMVALELFVFRCSAASASNRAILRYAIGIAIATAVLGLLAILLLRPELLLSGYAGRDFTVEQRLLTQSRILWSYVAQFFWPNVQLLGVYHDDIVVSGGLLQPRTTLPAVLGWVTVVVGIVVSLVTGRLRMLALGMSLYLIGHAMESTLWPLEMYFEHRNYLPSIGLLLALCWAVMALLERREYLKYWIALGLVLLLTRNTLLLGSQALIWSDNVLLHLDAANGHPNSPRANYELAQIFAQRGALDEALQLVRKAADIDSTQPLKHAFVEAIYYCRARVNLPSDHWTDLVVRQWEVSAGDFSNQFSHLVRLMIDEECPAADGIVFANTMRKMFILEDHVVATPRMLGSLVLLENHLQRYSEGLEYAEMLLKKSPGAIMALQFKLYFASALRLPEQRADALNQLLALREAGRLSRQEIYNLELFINE
jgi:tetratricopeptide (TPR) repeat protein